MEEGIVLYLGNILISKASLGRILGNNHIPGQFTTEAEKQAAKCCDLFLRKINCYLECEW